MQPMFPTLRSTNYVHQHYLGKTYRAVVRGKLREIFLAEDQESEAPHWQLALWSRAQGLGLDGGARTPHPSVLAV